MKVSWFGAALVLVGAALLLDRTGVVSLGWHGVFWGAVAVFGAVKVVNCFVLRKAAPDAKGHCGIFWGTLLFLFGLYNLLEDLGAFEVHSYFGFPVLFVMVGLAFLAVFVSRPRDWHVLIPACLFIGVGAVMIVAELGMLDRWEIQDAVRSYWPIALILFGGALLLNRRSAGS